MPVQTRVLIISVAAALIFGAALVAYRQTIPQGGLAASATAPEGLKVHLIRCELGAKESLALVKVRLRLRNDGTAPVRIGPGSFWMLDAEGLPHLDGYAAEKPDAPPLKLASGREGPEMELKFTLAPNLLSRSLVLLIGEAPAGKVVGSPPPSQGIRVPLKEDGAPKGPFVEGEWKTFVGTRWR